MKYWWIKKYLPFFEKIEEKDLKTKKGKQTLQAFFKDANLFLILPSHYSDLFLTLKEDAIKDYQLQLKLGYYLYLKTVDPIYFKKELMNKNFYNLLKKMESIVDTYLPVTDYTMEDILEEIKELPQVDTSISKKKNNNISACYSCRNNFYTDDLIEKEGKSLCPYCASNTLYFDNDYIPMNTTFLTFAYLYHQEELPFSHLVSLLEEKVTITDIPSKECYHFIDDEEIGKVDVLAKTVTLSYEDYLSSLTGKEEDALRFSLLRLLQEVDKNKETSLSLDLSFFTKEENSSILAMGIYSSLLFYFLKEYFSNIEHITLIVSPKTKAIYESVFKTLIDSVKLSL